MTITKEIALLMALAAALAACGVKGPPERPAGWNADGLPVPVEGKTTPDTDDDTPRFPPPEPVEP